VDHWNAIEPIRSAIGDGDPFAWLSALPGTTFREKNGRRTFRFEQGGQGYFAKVSRGPGARETLKELLSLRTPPLDARREVLALERLHAAGIPAPQVAGSGVSGGRPLARRSFVITADVGTQRTLGEEASQLDPADHAGRRQLIQETAALVRRMHAAGVNHRDLYFGHILVRTERGARELVLIDLHRAQIWKHIPERWIVKDLGALGFAAADLKLSRTDRARFVMAYSGSEHFACTIRSARSLWKHVEARIRRTLTERERKGDRFGG
jgi:heptose I phosphotransferase